MIALASNQTLAQTNNCSEVTKACDEVIAKQDDLILVLGKRSQELYDENEKLSKALAEMSREVDSGFSSKLTYGALGVALGAVAAALIIK